MQYMKILEKKFQLDEGCGHHEVSVNHMKAHTKVKYESFKYR